MDDDNAQTDLNGQKLSKTRAKEAVLSTCRLRNGLNEDCLLKVMDFLHVDDLIQMCYMDSYYKDLIMKWIVGKKTLNLRGMTQVRKDKILEVIGKSLKKIVIYELDFKNFLETIIKYFAQDRLTEIELGLKHSMIDNFNNIHLSMPFFSNVRKFKLNVLLYQRCSTISEFLAAFFVAAPQLRHLQLFHVDIVGQWLKTNRLLSLTELHILEPYNVSISDLKIFLRNVPNLKRFTYEGEEDITTIGSTLIEFCPHLETFEDIQIHTRRRFALEVNRYDFLASLSNLANITLKSYTFCGTDLYQPLVKLATKKIVQLKVVLDLDGAVESNEIEWQRIMRGCSFGNFDSLQSLELDVINYTLAGDLRCEFLLHFATQLKNLER